MHKKLNISKLGYPKWFNILFFCLTLLGPIGLIVYEGLKAKDDKPGIVFKLSFMTICIGIIVWFFIKKLLINKIETKLISKQVALEHDYSIDNGNLNKIKYLWYQNETWLTIFQLVSIILYGGLAIIILMGVASELMKIKGILFIIMTLYVIAYTIKFMLILTKKRGDSYEDANSTTNH